MLESLRIFQKIKIKMTWKSNQEDYFIMLDQNTYKELGDFAFVGWGLLEGNFQKRIRILESWTFGDTLIGSMQLGKKISHALPPVLLWIFPSSSPAILKNINFNLDAVLLLDLHCMLSATCAQLDVLHRIEVVDYDMFVI